MNKIESDFAITPETKLAALLEKYPQLEKVLIEMAPAFRKLRNPILRKTVAKVATLQQVAQIGGVSLVTIINKLRAAVGQQVEDRVPDRIQPDDGVHLTPPWFDESKIVRTLDARPILEAGQHPMTQVLEEIKNLGRGEIYELMTPFAPAPLIDMIKKKGFQVWSKQMEPELIKNYFISQL